MIAHARTVNVSHNPKVALINPMLVAVSCCFVSQLVIRKIIRTWFYKLITVVTKPFFKYIGQDEVG
jgi:hypothetical protein